MEEGGGSELKPMDAEQLREQAHKMVDFIADYYKTIQNFPVLSQVQPGYLGKLLPDSAPTHPESLHHVLNDVQEKILPGVTHWQSPNYFAYFPSNSSIAGFLGEMLSAGLNIVGFSWITSPAATELETIVLDWLAKALLLPHDFFSAGQGGGVIQGTASEAVLVVLVAARDKILRAVGRNALPKLVTYASDQTHSALQKACQIGGLNPELCRLLKTDSSTNFALSPDVLSEAISNDIASGLIPFFFCATVGTTSSTAVNEMQLLLLKQGGQEIYVGPLGHNSSNLINYFEGIQGVSKIKDGYNPATWMLEVTTSSKEVELGIDFAELYKNSELYRRNKALIQELSTPASGSKDLYFTSKYSRSFWTQCMACLWKQHWSYWRNPVYTAIRFLYSTAVAVLLGTMFWNLGSKIEKEQDLFNAMGSMYSAVLLIGIKNSNSVQPVVAVERTVFYRERAAGMYSAFPYAFAQVVIELPHVFVQSLVYGLIVYAMIGFEWTVVKVVWCLFFMYFTFLYFTFYGMMSVAMTPNNHISTIVSSAFYSVWNIFSGFIVPRPSIPVWWRWYSWANPVAWSLYGLVASQYGDVKQNIETSDGKQTVEEFLRNYFGFKHDFLGVVALVNVAFPIAFAFVFAISIKMFNFQRR